MGRKDRCLAEVRQVLGPSRAAKDGLLPPMLVALTVVTGLVDSFSYLQLGHVIVANMTGNLVFLALALAGASGASTRSGRRLPVAWARELAGGAVTGWSARVSGGGGEYPCFLA